MLLDFISSTLTSLIPHSTLQWFVHVLTWLLLYLSSAPRIAHLLWLNKSVHRRKYPTWDLPALAPNTRSNVVHLDVNHPLMPRLSAKALACSLRLGMHQLCALWVDFGCSICSAFCLQRGAAKQACAEPPCLLCTALGVAISPLCFASWNQRGNEMRLNALLCTPSSSSLGSMTRPGCWALVQSTSLLPLWFERRGAAWNVLPTSHSCWPRACLFLGRGETHPVRREWQSKEQKKKIEGFGSCAVLWKTVLNIHELSLATLLWGSKSKGFQSCWTDAQPNAGQHCECLCCFGSSRATWMSWDRQGSPLPFGALEQVGVSLWSLSAKQAPAQPGPVLVMWIRLCMTW